MDNKPEEPREHLIITAVNFLTNPNVQRSTLNQKQRFLRDKGLTETEIQMACERAGVFTGLKPPSPPPNPQIHTETAVWKQPKPLTTLNWIKEILSPVVVFSGFAYLVYKFYKKFIEPWLFGGDKKKAQKIEEKVELLSVKVDTDLKVIGHDVARIRDEISQFDVRREMQNIKSDLDSIKGLLLNKKQFASPNLPVVPPSIPSWQLKARHDSENDKNDDAGSGSGSSETEVVTKNSDSSLEIM